MQSENKSSTIKTNLFDNFIWKRLPIEHDYVTIIFCLDKYKNTDNSDDFLSNIENENTKKAIKYIINIMPHNCIINIDDYSNYKYYKDNLEKNIELDNIIDKLTKLETDKDINFVKDRLNKLQQKKSYIFTYSDTSNKLLNITFDSKFNETHRLCVGEIENIPKYNLSIADYIFFENKDVLNKYLESQNHNLRIKISDAPLFLIDKCNYEYYNLFNFNKHITL
jgi:hypothetical protein